MLLIVLKISASNGLKMTVGKHLHFYFSFTQANPKWEIYKCHKLPLYIHNRSSHEAMQYDH